MEDNEIIKALECCSNAEPCENCPYQKQCDETDLAEIALDLINRQKAEIERLERSAKQWEDTAKDLYISRENIKAEAVKEFAERFERYLLSQLTSASLNKKEWINFCLEELDNLKKEMAGDTK